MASQQGGGGARPKTPRQGSGPTQQASAPAKEGWLFVQRKTLFGLVKRQKRRYCVLDGHSWLVIYKDRTKKKVKAVYLLQQILDVTATVPSSHVFEIRMTRDDPPLVLASRDQADMLDWMGALNGAISFANGPAPHEDVPSQGKL
ncbi:uncharacterized protein [Littorina saxatilis]|uniref:uncharacterized protein isoform X1 n=1 Tax=Littorina saxatilis TaxID=31220 RepID=UPI0038B67104